MPPRPTPIPLSSSPRANSSNEESTSPTIDQIPTRYGSFNTSSLTVPPTTASSSSNTVPLSHSASTESLPRNAVLSIEDLTEIQKAAIVRKHLLTAEDQRLAAAELEGTSGTPPRTSPTPGTSFGGRGGLTADDPDDIAVGEEEEEGDETFPIPYHLPGGDITAPLYKWAAQQDKVPSLRRSKSLMSIERPNSRRPSRGDHERVIGVEHGNESDEMAHGEMLEPGGFRRDFVIRKLTSNGDTMPSNGRFTRSFVDFLSIYGHFAGEDLEEISEEEDEEEDEELDYEENVIPRYVPASTDSPFFGRPASSLRGIGAVEEGLVTERSTLVRRGTGKALKRGDSKRPNAKRRSTGVGEHGDATITQAVLMLLKSFVGTGVLFLGRA